MFLLFIILKKIFGFRLNAQLQDPYKLPGQVQPPILGFRPPAPMPYNPAAGLQLVPYTMSQQQMQPAQENPKRPLTSEELSKLYSMNYAVQPHRTNVINSGILNYPQQPQQQQLFRSAAYFPNQVNPFYGQQQYTPSQIVNQKPVNPMNLTIQTTEGLPTKNVVQNIDSSKVPKVIKINFVFLFNNNF